MIRVVIDTNILVSALLNGKGFLLGPELLETHHVRLSFR
jgi:predicted nucleic acid-binding protein